MNKIYVKIEGIHCEHCISKITNEFKKNKNIKDIIIKNNIAHITYTGKLSNKTIINTLKELDYFTKDEYISDDLNILKNKISFKEFMIILFSIIMIIYFLNMLFGFNIFNIIPTIDSNLTYGMIFVTGLLTSIHCISMCGAINLIATTNISTKRNIKRPLLYNLGRVLSYTIIGCFAGLLGGILSINQSLMGIIIIVASIIMLCLSLSMLGLFQIKLPHFIRLSHKQTSNAFIIGLLNGFMPCGPLQAMQIYALSTGDFIKGAFSMFLFGIGTVPLMFFVGIIFNIVNGKKKILLNKIASVLILVLSLVMLNRGLISLNIDIFPNNNYDGYTASIIQDEYQIIEFDLQANGYEDIILQKDIPVKMIINVDQKYLTLCNNEVYISEFGIKQKLEVGRNIIEFIPDKKGDYIYTCWMNMIKNNIKVIDNESYFKKENK